MLPLDSPRWSGLPHAFGVQPPTPDLIRALHPSPSKRALDALWNHLCHQYTVYPATFAAFPHIGALLTATSSHPHPSVIAFLGTVVAYADPTDTEPLDGDVRAWYEQAIQEVRPIADSAFDSGIAEDAAVYVLAAVAALTGYRAAARILPGFADKEFTPTCPHCERELYVWPTLSGMAAAAEDPVFHPWAVRTEVVPTPVPATPTHQWLATLANRRPADLGARLLPHLFGTVDCPACKARFRLFERLEEETGAV